MKVLLIQINQPGDAILTTPALRWLINQGHEVHLFAQDISVELLKTMPGIASLSKVHRGGVYFFSEIANVRFLRKTKFDRVFIFTQSTERALFYSLISQAKMRFAYPPSRNKAWMQWLSPVTRWVDKLPNSPANPFHEVEQHMALVGASPEETQQSKLEYIPTSESIKWLSGWLPEYGITSPYLLFHLTARWMSKSWPEENAIAFLKEFRKKSSLPIVITSGPASIEKGYAQAIEKKDLHTAAALGTITPHQLGALISKSSLFLGMDSMPAHLAAACDISGVSLFGSTHPKNFGPWKSKITALGGGACHCNNTGNRTCLRGAFTDCLREISPQHVLNVLKEKEPSLFF